MAFRRRRSFRKSFRGKRSVRRSSRRSRVLRSYGVSRGGIRL